MAEATVSRYRGEGKRAHFFVRGRVQGVGFRYHTRAEAERLGLSGWVRNLPDGGVEVQAEGPSDRVNELIAWCRIGPPSAKVERLEALEEGPASAEGPPVFTIR